MKKAEVKNSFICLVAEQAGVDESDVTLGSDFVDDLGLGSFDGVDLIVSLEDQFNIKIDGRDLEEIQTVEQGLEYLYTLIETED